MSAALLRAAVFCLTPLYCTGRNQFPLARRPCVILAGLMLPQQAQAQCGSSASSCRNCHEIQKEMPVNANGTNWHEAHSFGDFCEFCHAADLAERDDVYAVALGVTIDFETLENNSVTVRHRDTTKQERISVDQLLHYLQDQLQGTYANPDLTA